MSYRRIRLWNRLWVFTSLFGGLLSFVFLAAGPAGLLGLEGWEGGEVDFLLWGSPDEELVGIDKILANSDVSLVDQHSGLMDGFGLEALLIDSGLESLIEEFVDGKAKDVIELEFLIGQQSISMHSVEKGGPFEKSPLVFFLESEQFSGCLSEFGEDQVYSPDLSLVLEAVFTH